MTNTKAVGDIAEELAARYLEERGYVILERNAEYAGCEVDIICECFADTCGSVSRNAGIKRRMLFSRSRRTEKVTVFCEVKARYGDGYGTGAEAVTPYKVGRYVTAAKAFMSQHFRANCDVRFDIIEVGDGGINHIENAFDCSDAKFAKR